MPWAAAAEKMKIRLDFYLHTKIVLFYNRNIRTTRNVIDSELTPVAMKLRLLLLSFALLLRYHFDQ